MTDGLAERCRKAVSTALPFPVARMFVASTFLYGILGAFVYLLVAEGQNPPTILWMTVVALALAAAYVVFGKANVDSAVDAAQDLAGNDSNDDGEN
jgi:4-hydroxybenzoate polyprenyltransferase